MNSEEQVASLVKRLYEIVGELGTLFPGRKFTPDGHLVGSIGEVLAATRYQLELLPASAKTHDARDSAGRWVQIKATQGSSVGISSEPDFLLVLKLNKDGQIEEVYNGPGKPAWEATGKGSRTGQRPISLRKLKTLMQSVSSSERVPVRPS